MGLRRSRLEAVTCSTVLAPRIKSGEMPRPTRSTLGMCRKTRAMFHIVLYFAGDFVLERPYLRIFTQHNVAILTPYVVFLKIMTRIGLLSGDAP